MKKNSYSLESFLKNVNKLTPGRTACSEQFGKVTCMASADHSKGHVARLKRTGYGTRKFKIAGIKSYFTPAKLRAKLEEMA